MVACGEQNYFVWGGGEEVGGGEILTICSDVPEGIPTTSRM